MIVEEMRLDLVVAGALLEVQYVEPPTIGRNASCVSAGAVLALDPRFAEPRQHRERYALYVFDYGAPVGFGLAAAHPQRVTAIVTQNGNAYEEGLGASTT